MTPFQRYAETLAGRPVDHLPRVPILMAFAAEYIGANYGAFASDYRVLAEANLRCAKAFDFDQLSAISDPYRETAGFGAEVIFVEDGVPRCTAPPLAEDPDFARLPHPDPNAPGRMRDRIDGVTAMKAAGEGRYSVLGWVEGPAAEAADLRGVSTFLMDMMMDAAYAEALMDRCIETAIEFALAQLDAGADTIGIGDAIASQVSPEMYEALIFPREQVLVNAIQEAGGWVRLHICGDTTHLLPYFKELGCHVIDLDWQVDLIKARATLGPDQCMVTNLDPVRAVKESDPAHIQEALAALYEAVGNPLLIGAGCEIPPGTAEENLRALCTPLAYRP